MQQKWILSSADADVIMAACRAEATRNGWAVSIAIVDEAGTLQQLLRLDGAGRHTPQTALLKARSSALTGTPTQALEARSAARPALGRIPGFMPLQGGMPICYQNDVLGAVGVSGAQSQDDERIAEAGIAALLAALS